MGASGSTTVATGGDEQEVYLGEGAFGVTFRKGDHIIKRMKYDRNDHDFHNEMVFYGWVNSLPPHEQKHFCRLLSHKIYYDTSFSHVPSNKTVAEMHKKRIEQRNRSTWTVDLVIEDKGRKIEPSAFVALSPAAKYGFLLQLLEIVSIMKKHHVFHEDIQRGNILFDDRTQTLALIDYGVTFLQGQRPSEYETRNEMMMQVTSLMVNFEAAVSAFERPVVLAPGEKEFDRDADFYRFLQSHKETQIIHHYLLLFASTYGYELHITARNGAVEVHPTLYGVGDNLLRVARPDFYLKMYNLKTDLAPPFYGLDDVKYIFDNWNRLDRIILFFQNKMAEWQNK